MCQCCDVSRLVFTSTAEITLKPYLGRTYITIIINQTEMRATPPKDLRSLSMPGYSESKFQAEKLILDANGSMTSK